MQKKHKILKLYFYNRHHENLQGYKNLRTAKNQITARKLSAYILCQPSEQRKCWQHTEMNSGPSS